MTRISAPFYIKNPRPLKALLPALIVTLTAFTLLPLAAQDAQESEEPVSIADREPPSIADVTNMKEVTKIHEILLGGDIIIVEGLTNLEALSNDKVGLVALPLKIKDGDGAPARVIAIEK